MSSPKTVDKALNALDGMATIVKREMTGRVGYVSEIVDDELAKKGAICGGRKYCAIGSLWVGAGILPKVSLYGDATLSGTDEDERDAFLRPRHSLRLAYDALNEAADAYVERTGAHKCRDFHAPIEALFEGQDDGLNRAELLKVINDAKRRVRKAAK